MSFAILLVELLLTRIFSVVMYHHYSFLSVSLAMLGLGIGGLVVNLLPRRFDAGSIGSVAPYLSVAFGVTVALACLVASRSQIVLDAGSAATLRLNGIFVVCAVPFTLGGIVIALILAFNVEQANRLYFFDLLGAGLACALMAPLVSRCGAPTALLIAAAVGALGGTMLATTNRARAVTLTATAILLLLAGSNAGNGFFDLRYVKGRPAAETLVTRWNSFSRVDVLGSTELMTRLRRPVSWGYSSRLAVLARELHLVYDADAMTQIVGFDGDLRSVEYLLWDVTTAAHHARPNPRVLVIGSGGGRDVLAALAAGSDAVTGVEINDITVDLMRHRFRDYTAGLYDGYSGVEIVVEDGRSYLRRTPDRYDLIQASLVDTWAASAAGAYALAENSLYTVEAFDDYFESLAPDGIISFSRWYHSPPNEVLRVVALAGAALAKRGVHTPGEHIVVIRTDSRFTRRPSLATVLVKRSPFTAGEIRSLKAWAQRMLFAVSYVPEDLRANDATNVFARYLDPDLLTRDVIESATADLSPTTDDRPFFFDKVPLWPWIRHRLGFSAPAYADEELPAGSASLLTALAATSLAAVVMFVLPIFALGRASRDESHALTLRKALPWVAYFACLGIGYIVVEIVLIQRFNLYLGNPTYALAVVLFTLLLSSALGSMCAQRMTRFGWLYFILISVAVALGIAAVTLGTFTSATLSGSTSRKIALSMMYIAPLGFVMGMPFPTGLRHAGRVSASLVSWCWAVNGGMSVFGSVLAVVVSMSVGFSACLGFGLSAYAVALLLVPFLTFASST